MFGSQEMLRHILRRRAELLWQWGDLRRYRIDMRSIDSAYEGRNEVMGPVQRRAASQRTRRLLLDDFMPVSIEDHDGAHATPKSGC